MERVGEHRRGGEPRGTRLPRPDPAPGARLVAARIGVPHHGPAGGTYGSPANVARRERTRALAARRGCAPGQVALAYVFSQPFPVSAVVAASTVEKMRLNLEAARMRLSAEEVEALEG